MCEAEQQVCDQYREERIEWFNCEVQESAEEDFFADAGKSGEQDQVRKAALTEQGGDGLSQKITNPRKTFRGGNQTDEEEHQHGQCCDQSQQQVPASEVEFFEGVHIDEPAKDNRQQQQTAFKDGGSCEKLLRRVFGDGTVDGILFAELVNMRAVMPAQSGICI